MNRRIARRSPALAVLMAAVFLRCTDAGLIDPPDDGGGTAYDDKLKLSGRICTTDPSDLVFPLKVMFVIDTSGSMKDNDPVDPAEPDPIAQTGRSRAIRDVISRFIDIRSKFSQVFCSTGTSGCGKGVVGCSECASVAPAMCVGPDCTGATCPANNGTCMPVCDTTKPGCGPGEKACSDCPTPGDQCHGGVCGKLLDPGVEFAVMRFGSAKQVLTNNRGGQPGFTNDIKELVTSLAQVNNSGSVTDYEGALSMVFQTLGTDMAEMQKANAAAVARSKYVVIFLSDGQPDPQVNDETDWDNLPPDLKADLVGTGNTEAVTEYNVQSRILRRVKEVLGLRMIYHVGDVRLHTAYLAGKNSTSVENEATYLLKQMAQIGQGTFRNFLNGEELNFLHVDFSSLRRVFRLKSFLVTNMNARPRAGSTVIDSDGDGVDDQTEIAAGMSLTRVDTEGDGFSDTVEHFFRASGWDSLNPLDADCSIKGNDLDEDGLADDTDGDGLLDCEERFLGTSKDLIDTDADGIPDGVEVKFGTNPGAVDVEDDLDFDGMPNGDEIRLHTDPASDDAVHRSRKSYRYNVWQAGTGIETVGRRCLADADCPSQADCKDGYCRCLGDDRCSSQATCQRDLDCVMPGELCDAGKCKGKWTCQVPAETMKGKENVCAMRKSISCYQYEVENIALVTSKPPEGGQAGWNRIDLVFGEVPFDDPMDYGNFSRACVWAWYQSADGAKLPAVGELEVPEIAWHDPRDFARSYEATSTVQGTGKMACGTGPSGAVHCDPGDACVSVPLRRCRLVGCLCPDGTFGLCATPRK